MATATIKSVKTNEKYAGNQYGYITHGSKVDRYYSVMVGDKVICEDWFNTLNGGKLAAELVKIGMTEDQIGYVDCDSHGLVKYLHVRHPEVIGMDTNGKLKFLAAKIKSQKRFS